jgi:hypothetical protein
MDWSAGLLFVGDDWAENHHDVELQNETGRVLGRAKLPEGIAGIARLHAMIGEQLDTPSMRRTAGQPAQPNSRAPHVPRTSPTGKGKPRFARSLPRPLPPGENHGPIQDRPTEKIPTADPTPHHHDQPA